MKYSISSINDFDRYVGYIDITNIIGTIYHNTVYTITQNCYISINGKITMKNWTGQNVELQINGVAIFYLEYDKSMTANEQVSIYNIFTFPVYKGDTIYCTGADATLYGLK